MKVVDMLGSNIPVFAIYYKWLLFKYIDIYSLCIISIHEIVED